MDDQWELFGNLDGLIVPMGMIRIPDHDTSIEAAIKITKHCRNKLHEEVRQAFRDNGSMIDEVLERLPQFLHYGISTVKKRRTELYQAGEVYWTGRRLPNDHGFLMKEWMLKDEYL